MTTPGQRRHVPHSFITTLSPLVNVDGEGRDPAMELREQLMLSNQTNSPFLTCPMVHMARLSIIHDIVPALGDVNGDHLGSKYLLFIAELDGDVNDFLDHFYAHAPDFIHAVWGICHGYPEYRGAVFFRRYMQRCSQPVQLPYAAFPDTVEEVLCQLQVQDRVRRFALEQSGAGPEQLLEAFRELERELDALPPPPPGSI